MHFIKTALVAMIAFSVDAIAEPVTVPVVDLAQYVGRWYQISANPTPFQVGCHCSQQTLTAQADGNVAVYNSCNLTAIDGKLTDIRGVATSTDKATNARFTVDFNLPWNGDYWIVGLAPDYSWAAVSDSKGDVLYILAKAPTMTPEAYNAAVTAAAAARVDTSKLEQTVQLGCTYPPL